MSALSAALWVFAICAALVFYTYFLYPLILLAIYSASQVVRDLRYLGTRQERRRCAPRDGELPTLSLIIAAYNEQDHLPAKLQNLAAMTYPIEKLEILIVSDGSTDATNAILQQAQLSNLRTIFLPVRGGKPNALNCGVSEAKNSILIFSDAATLFQPDALLQLVRHFQEPSIGVVCGALRFVATAESKATEGIYWKYESALRLMEGRLGATLTASGAIYAMRRECFQPLDASTLIDDLVLPMRARKLRFRVLYDPEVIGTEFAASSVRGEFTRRVRIAIGSFRALGELSRVPLDFMTLLAFLSHKLLRWMVPFALIGMFFSNFFLLSLPAFQLILIAQILFYAWAATGFLLQNRLPHMRYALLGYFLVAMNAAFLVGFVRCLLGNYKPAWQRVS
jgi:cellulose synthase/poly-beta-1,6-N-acetylglucosamine synthase-like glycosyltransferase